MTKKQAEKETEGTGREIQVTRGAEPVQGTWLSPFEEMEHMFDEFFPRGWMRPLRWGWPRGDLRAPFEGKTPRVDVVDREDEILVRAELPGVSKDDIEVTLTESTLRIRAATKREVEEEKGDFHRREISRGELLRTLPLAGAVDADKARAKFENGLLELTLPKTEKAKRRSIKVE